MSDFDNKPSDETEIFVESESKAGFDRLPTVTTERPSTVPAVLTSSASAPSVRKRGGRPVLTLERLSRLKDMYMSFETFETIADTLTMSVKTIHRHVHKPRESGLSWAQARGEQQRIMAESVMVNSSHLLGQASDKAIRILHLSLAAYHKTALLDPSAIELKDLEKIANIAEKLDKLSRLDTGRPTSIHGLSPGEPVSKDRTDAILKADPFTVAEFSEVKDE